MNDPLLPPKDMSFTVDEALAEAARWENGSYFDGLPAWRWALVALAKEVRRLKNTGTDYAELVKVLREDAESFREWTPCACFEAGSAEVTANTLADAADAIEALTRLTRSREPGGDPSADVNSVEYKRGWDAGYAFKAGGGTRPSPDETTAEWQPIETAPKDGRWLLLGSATNCFMGYWEFGEWKDQRDAVRDPTHWRPLPAKPRNAGGNDGR